MRRTSIPWAVAWAVVASGCVYYNTLYNANQQYDDAQEFVRDGNVVSAKQSLDSVIAKTGRVIRDHPSSKYADDAAILRARSEIQLMEIIPSLNTPANRRSARGSVLTVIETSKDEKMRRVATGLLGEIELAEGRLAMSDSLLTVALDGDLKEGDRAEFYVARGRVRIALGRVNEAEADLRAAVSGKIESAQVRLDLARTLARLAQYDEATEIFASLLRDERLADAPQALSALGDSLVTRAPDTVIRTLSEATESGIATQPQKARLYLYIGRAWQAKGVQDSALMAYDRSDEAAPNTAASLEAIYYASRWRIKTATSADEVLVLRSPIQRAAVRRSAVMDTAAFLYADVQTFGHWVEVFRTRGSTEAAALLRAAEIAVDDLHAPGVARSLYLGYVEAAPASPWTPKAILGALALSGQGPQAGSAEEAETDRQLRQTLRDIPAGNPYVLASAAAETGASDSAYSEAERQLHTQLQDMRRLFAPDPVQVAADPDSAEVQEEAASEREEGIEF